MLLGLAKQICTIGKACIRRLTLHAHTCLLKSVSFLLLLSQGCCTCAGLVGESSSDSSNEDDDDHDDDDEVEDSEGGEETCPSGCDPSLYDKVLH